MGSILSPNKGIQLPHGLAEQREKERIQKLIPVAIEQENKARDAFQLFLDEHNVFFQVHLDYRKTEGGERPIGQGMTFISKLRLPEEEQKIQ